MVEECLWLEGYVCGWRYVWLNDVGLRGVGGFGVCVVLKLIWFWDVCGWRDVGG